MSDLAWILLLSWLAGFAATIGGLFAWVEGSAETLGKQELVHSMVAFGGGILLAAVAFALAPHAMHDLSVVGLAASVIAGGLVFLFLDAWVSRRSGSLAQLMALLMDFIPEAIALGALFGTDRQAGYLLAGFIAAQNLPEGFNAFRELNRFLRPRAAVAALAGVGLLGPLAAYTGYGLLQEQATMTAVIMAFATGGILYLIFQDIAPQARMQRHWAPPLGAVVGFTLGMVGERLLG